MSTRSRSNPGGARVLEMGEVRPYRERKPPWFKVKMPGSPRYLELKQDIEGDGLHTVCEEAACPNIGECWDSGTATFMILGDTCTRRCGIRKRRRGRIIRARGSRRGSGSRHRARRNITRPAD